MTPPIARADDHPPPAEAEDRDPHAERSPARPGYALKASLRGQSVGLMAEKGWMLEVHCGGCGHVARLANPALSDRFAAPVTAGEILDRMVCRCGRRTGWAITLQQDSRHLHPRLARWAARQAQDARAGRDR